MSRIAARMSCQLKRKTADISHDTCSSEEDKGGNKKVGKKNAKKIKKSRIEQTFKIHYSEFLTSADRNERRNSSVKLKLDIETNEDEIRNSLISELPQLRGKNFSFFTKDNDGRYYSCPCKLKCDGKDHIPAEWNARNISRAARSNRTVYISIEIDNKAPSTSGCNGDPINSHLNEQERDSASYLHQSASCPNLPSAGSTGLEDRTMTRFVGQNNSDLRRQQLELTQFPQACPVESDRPGDRNRGNAGVQESSSASSRGWETTLPRQENRKFKSLENLDKIAQPEQIQITHLQRVPHGETTDSFGEQCQEGVPKSLNASSSGFESISGESSHRPSANVQDESTSDFDLLLEYVESKEPPLEIKEIVPNNGDVKGGFTFYLELTTRCKDDFEVQFGQNHPINVQRIDETHYKGTVPENASSLVGEEEVRIVNTLQDTKNAVTFRYTDESLKERNQVKENIKYEVELRKYQPTLKGIAKANGHEELASLLEKKYLMFGDNENDIDGKEDCKKITKGIVEDQSIEKWSLQSTDSFKSLQGYLGDWESPTPLSSLQVSVDETFPGDTVAEQQAYLVFNGRDQSAICHEKGEMSDENKEDGESYTSFSLLQVSSGEVWLEGMFDVQKATPGRQDSNTSDKWPSEGGANAGERRSSDVQDYTVKEPQETLESKSPEKLDSYHEKGQVPFEKI
ncbi:uncharacterized protein LOC111337459 isoform X1 [Stylophora pistillata]|uniref:uncharacterized protein LOC111337459 isoform X1 n=2 Tax=Stylophora pistillata TaxID=50429 RepID=UPI000C04C4F1|nr:uncharacterized protein LOC111337459 isoform X1 [Stylophora pistillata]